MMAGLPSAAWRARRRCGPLRAAPRPARSALLAWAIAAVARARPASFWASCASSVSATSLASTSPFLTRIAFVGQHLGDAQALDLGPDQDFLARHQRAGGQHRRREVGRRDAGDRHGRGQRQQVVVRDLLGARLGRAGRARQRLADQRQRDHQEASASTPPINIFRMIDPYCVVWLLLSGIGAGAGPGTVRHGIEERARSAPARPA